MNPREAAKNPTDQGLYNQSLSDQLTRALNRIATLETQLAQSIQRQTSLGNVAIFGESVSFEQGTSKVIFIGNSSRPPTEYPVAGIYLYADGDHLMALGSAGTSTPIAEP
jgi:hypothetical protein